MRFLILAGLIFLAGCATNWRKAEVYPLSYDQTYLIALSALDDLDEWHILETDKNRGLITIEKTPFFRPDGELTVIVKNLEPFRTKVELYGKRATPFNQKFFKAIDRHVEERALTYPT